MPFTTWEEWKKELILAYNKFWGKDLLSDNDADGWKDYYDDRYTPEEAVREDASHAESA
jgi:hypothetical protein